MFRAGLRCLRSGWDAIAGGVASAGIFILNQLRMKQELNRIFRETIFNEQVIDILADDDVMEFLLCIAEHKLYSIKKIEKGMKQSSDEEHKKLIDHYIYKFCNTCRCRHYHSYNNKINSDKHYEMCCNFIMYQLYRYMEEEEQIMFTIEDFRNKGFLVASPWHGDVEKAPILFLGPNPGINMNCIFPRLHVDKNKKIKVTLAGESYGDTTWKYDGKCYHNRFNIEQDQYCDDNRSLINRLINSKNYVTLHDFFKDRIRPTKRTGSLDVLIPEGGKIQPDHDQKYWRGIVTATDILLNAAGNYDGPCTEKILSSEIIPFGSMGSFGLDDDYLDWCWNNYTQPLLENCGAKIIILVGGVAAKCFWRKVYAEKKNKQYRRKEGELTQNEFIEKIQDKKEPIMRKVGSSCRRNKECYIAYIDHPSWGGLSKESIETLRKLGEIDAVREILNA